MNYLQKLALSCGFAALIAFVGCGPTHDGFISRNFHDLNAQYNGYYNAKLKIADGVDRLAESQPDQYDRILPIFKYGDITKAKSVFPPMDEAIKKTGTVIQRHTIKDKRNGNEKPEKEKWIDDNWIAYGQALFYKHDYIQALEVFKFVESTYKKEQGRHEASLWIAKTYLQLTQLREAEEKLDYLKNQKDVNKKIMAQYEIVAADYHLQTKNYPQAIEHLTKGIPDVKRRQDKIRYMFILAQLHQQAGDFRKAFDLYSDVIKKRPPYEMEFNARINRARVFDAQSESGNKVKAELTKMVKDPKNKEYLDQVYYALAGIAHKEGNDTLEMQYLQMSIQASTSSTWQKAISYLELGKIYLAKKDYKPAQAYYDSAVSNMSNEHPDYPDVLVKRNSLTKLIKNLNIIYNEDSLQTLARMTDEQRDKIVSDVILKEEEAKKQQEEEEKNQQFNQIFNNDPQSQQQANQFNRGSGASWYFYNTQAMAFGSNEFTRKWGNRKLEDNWRRSNKQSSIAEEEEVAKVEKKEYKDPKEAREARKKELLAKVPLTEEALQKSTTRVVDAYYNAGMIYNEQLNDKEASAKILEELLSRYPDSRYTLPVWYQLYKMYSPVSTADVSFGVAATSLNNPTKAEYYKNLILTKFPDSEYANIIRNPNYYADKNAQKSKLELFYEETYRKYLNGEYEEVKQRKMQAEQMYPANALLPKFDMLRTLAIGRTQPLSVFTASLQDIVRNYSTDEVKTQAQEILEYINGMGTAPGNGSLSPAGGGQVDISNDAKPPVDTVKRLFTYNPDTIHYVIIAYRSNGVINPERFKNKLSDYNTKYYSMRNYSFNTQVYDHLYQMIVVRDFPNKQEAMLYHTGLNENDEVYMNIDPDLYQQFVISINNFAPFTREKKMDEYLDFFRQFYR